MSTAVLEACWLTALVVLPLLFNPFGTYPASIYKAAFLHTLVGVMVAVLVLKAGGSLGFTRQNWRQWLLASHALKSFLKTPLMAPALALAGFYVLSSLFSISQSASDGS